MVNEAARCLEEKIVDNVEYLDMAMLLGTGFPAFEGGLLKYADNTGLTNIVNRLTALENLYGVRFTPSKLLKEKAEKNETFYS